ncbi:hypothetical protein B0H34DRAFT_761440 [Crassisporium funariophilum]|nr:hypothetical protein B0H34DRAFT_761440 [Crassisporium funariophilum]
MAAERLTNNPHLETLPDHSGPHYDVIRTLMTNTGMSEEEAVESLNTSWTRVHEERIQAWDQQVLEDTQEQDEQRRLAQEQEDLRRAQLELEQENERQEAKKKRPKMNDFDDDAMVDDFITLRPLPYALRRLEDFEYVKLWYFTQEGCIDAAQNQRTQSKDTFGFTKIDEMVSLRPVSALRASKNIIQDIDLTWRQMEIAKTTLIQQITKCRWPDKAVMAIAQFSMNLEVHQYRQRAYGEQALLIYQARVWREWHDRLKQNQGYNIAKINDALLQAIHREIMDKRQAESIDE